MKMLFLLTALGFFFFQGFSQNYLGYNKDFIVKALKSQRTDMKGPIVVKAANDNYIVYIGKDGKRAVYYHFKTVTMTTESGKTIEDEICTNYISKNKCESYTNCPGMDEVIRSLDSHFTPSGQYFIWIDYAKTVPHEWVIVRDRNYFEVYVSELVK